MPIPQTVVDQVKTFEEQGYSSAEILLGLQKSQYKNVADQAGNFKAQGYADDEILSGLKTSPIEKPSAIGEFASEVWKGIKATPETAAGMATGAAAWPLSKLGGVAKTITTGAEAGRETERQIAEYFTYQPKGKTAQESLEMVGKVIEKGLWPAHKVAEVAEKMGLVTPEGKYFLETAGELGTFAAIPKIKAEVKAAIKKPPVRPAEIRVEVPPKPAEVIPTAPKVAEEIPKPTVAGMTENIPEIVEGKKVYPTFKNLSPDLPLPPDKLNFAAMTKGGTVIYDPKSPSHLGLLEKAEIPENRLASSGYVVRDKYFTDAKTAKDYAGKAEVVREPAVKPAESPKPPIAEAPPPAAAPPLMAREAPYLGSYKALAMRDTATGKIYPSEPGDRIHANIAERLEKEGIPFERQEAGFIGPGGEFIGEGRTAHMGGGEPKLVITGKLKEAPPEAVVSGALPRPSKEAGFLAVPSLKGMARSIKEFFDPVASLPEKEKFLGLRYRMMGNLDRVEGIVKRTWDKTKDLDPQVKVDIFHYLDGQLDISALPANVRPMANNLRTINNLVGEMLVKRGMLSRETFEAHKNQYVRYLYLKHILGDDVPLPVGKTGKMDLTYLKQRKDLTPEQRKAIGLIEDVSVAEPYGLSKPLSDIAKFDLYEKISENPEWVWEPSIVEAGDIKTYPAESIAQGQATIRTQKTLWRKVIAGDVVEPVELGPKRWALVRKDGTYVRHKMGIGKLAEEVESQRKMAKQAPAVPEIQARLKTLEDALEKAQEETGKVTEDFIQLPTTKTYGPLAGAFVRKEIARDIQPVLSWGKTESSAALNLAINVAEKGMAAFKVGKVALNIPTASRNIVSNFAQLNMSGIPLYDIPGYMVKAAESTWKKDTTWGQARRNGLFKTNWAEGEISEVLKTVKTMEGGSLPDIFGALGRLAKYYGRIDDFFKLAKFIEQSEKGVPRMKAIIEAQKWGMDYSLADPFVKKARRFAVPFMSYQYKIAPLIAESLAKRPWVIGKYLALPYIMQEVARQTLDLNEQDWKKLRTQLPLFIKRESTMTILPWKSPEGNAQWVNLQYFFPWGNYQQFAEATGQADIKGMWQQTGVGGPFLSIAHMLGTAKSDMPPNDPFTGQPVYNQLDSPTEKAIKMSEWLANQWIPPMVNLAMVEGEKPKGALGYTIAAIKGEKDIYGRQVSPEQAALRWAGINIAAPTPLQAAKERRAKTMELRASLARIMKDPNLSSKKKIEAMTRFSMETKKLGEVE